MADWNSVREGAARAANKAIRKTGEVADIASIYVKIKMAEAKLEGYYTSLGKLTYKQLKTGESQAEKIKLLQAKLEEEKQKKKDAKAAKADAEINGIKSTIEDAVEENTAG